MKPIYPAPVAKARPPRLVQFGRAMRRALDGAPVRHSSCGRYELIETTAGRVSLWTVIDTATKRAVMTDRGESLVLDRLDTFEKSRLATEARSINTTNGQAA